MEGVVRIEHDAVRDTDIFAHHHAEQFVDQPALEAGAGQLGDEFHQNVTPCHAPARANVPRVQHAMARALAVKGLAVAISLANRSIHGRAVGPGRKGQVLGVMRGVEGGFVVVGHGQGWHREVLNKLVSTNLLYLRPKSSEWAGLIQETASLAQEGRFGLGTIPMGRVVQKATVSADWYFGLAPAHHRVIMPAQTQRIPPSPRPTPRTQLPTTHNQQLTTKTAQMHTPTPITLEHTTVRLEPLDEHHADELFSAGQDPDLWAYNPRGPFNSRDDTLGWIREAHADVDAGRALPFAIVRRETNQAIGSTRYGDISVPFRHIEIGWTWITHAHQRTAVNTECKYLLLCHAFDDLGAMRVQLKTDSRNVRSRRAIERLGAEEEGILRKHMINHDGSIRDSVIYGIVDDDWAWVKGRLEARLGETT